MARSRCQKVRSINRFETGLQIQLGCDTFIGSDYSYIKSRTEDLDKLNLEELHYLCSVYFCNLYVSADGINLCNSAVRISFQVLVFLIISHPFKFLFLFGFFVGGVLARRPGGAVVSIHAS